MICDKHELNCSESIFTWVFCTQVEECHAHQSDCRCYGQRSNEAKKNTSEASETDCDLKQRRDHYGALDLAYVFNNKGLYCFFDKMINIRTLW